MQKMSKVGCFSPSFLHGGESASQVKHSEYICSREGSLLVKTGLTVKWWHLGDVNSGLGQGWYHSEVTWGFTG